MAGKTRLPLVRGRGGDFGVMPSASSFTKGIEVTSTPEAARYFCDQSEPFFENAPDAPPIHKVRQIIINHAERVELQKNKSSDRLWAGEQLLTDFEVKQRQAPAEASEEIRKALDVRPVGDMAFDVAVSDSSQLLRGYAADGRALDSQNPQDVVIITSMDKLFNAWLAERGMVSSSDGVIYERNQDGTIKTDEAGKSVRANADKLRELLNSKGDDGFEKYAQQNNPSLQLSIQQQPFPEQPAPTAESAASGVRS